jgi:hypothetical protein
MLDAYAYSYFLRLRIGEHAGLGSSALAKHTHASPQLRSAQCHFG